MERNQIGRKNKLHDSQSDGQTNRQRVHRNKSLRYPGECVRVSGRWMSNGRGGVRHANHETVPAIG